MKSKLTNLTVTSLKDVKRIYNQVTIHLKNWKGSSTPFLFLIWCKNSVFIHLHSEDVTNTMLLKIHFLEVNLNFNIVDYIELCMVTTSYFSLIHKNVLNNNVCISAQNSQISFNQLACLIYHLPSPAKITVLEWFNPPDTNFWDSRWG